MRWRGSGVTRPLWVYGDPMLRAPLPMLVLGLLLAMSGCGSDDGSDNQVDQPSQAAIACRKEWKGLEKKVGGRDELTNPSALASRWNTISATIDYYKTSATDKDCGKTLATQEKAMGTLQTFSARLARYDMELQLEKVKSDAEAYAAAPRPPAPKASKPPKGGKKAKAPARPPKPADIAAAVRTLTRQAPVATKDQRAGWEQASVAELGNAAAVKKSVKDLSFLSSESRAYRTCAAQLALVRKALSAKTS